MENLARVSLVVAGSIKDGDVINDNGCGTGTGIAAVVEAVDGDISISIKGNDINDDALAVYRKNAADNA
ncbi:s-adenosyl-l-methionine-dependent methyltransferase [Apiospora sp. TS-2023a]